MKSNELCKLKRNIDWQNYLLSVSPQQSDNEVINLVLIVIISGPGQSDIECQGELWAQSEPHMLQFGQSLWHYQLFSDAWAGNISNLNSNWTTLLIFAIMPTTLPSNTILYMEILLNMLLMCYLTSERVIMVKARVELLSQVRSSK